MYLECCSIGAKHVKKQNQRGKENNSTIYFFEIAFLNSVPPEAHKHNMYFSLQLMQKKLVTIQKMERTSVIVNCFNQKMML